MRVEVVIWSAHDDTAGIALASTAAMQKQITEHSSVPPDAWRGGSAEWIAVGALIAGSVGVLIGARRCGYRRGSESRLSQADTARFTSPHGDKLEPALR